MIEYIYNYSPFPQEKWPTVEDTLADERVFQFVKCVELQREPFPTPEKPGYALIGFNSDLGIRRNNGRLGAVQGSHYCRIELSKQAWHKKREFPLYDLGDIIIPDDDLDLGQSTLGKIVAQCHQNKLISVVLGGGHECAYGHYQGLAKAFPTQKIGIINFDAHFDMRPLQDGNKGTSGTSFLQIAESAQKENREFHYLVLGIQPYANTPSLVQTAKDHNVTYVYADELRRQTNMDADKVLSDFINSVELIYLTIDLDVFATACAPGVSAAQSLGLYPYAVMPLFTEIIQTGKVIGFDIAELSPKLDIESRTSQLCANLVNHFLHQNKHYTTRSLS